MEQPFVQTSTPVPPQRQTQLHMFFKQAKRTVMPQFRQPFSGFLQKRVSWLITTVSQHLGMPHGQKPAGQIRPFRLIACLAVNGRQ